MNLIEISIKRPVFAWVLMFTPQPTEWQPVGNQIDAADRLVTIVVDVGY